MARITISIDLERPRTERINAIIKAVMTALDGVIRSSDKPLIAINSDEMLAAVSPAPSENLYEKPLVPPCTCFTVISTNAGVRRLIERGTPEFNKYAYALGDNHQPVCERYFDPDTIPF